MTSWQQSRALAARRNRVRRLEPLLQRLRDERERLDGVVAEIEDEFMSVGARLEATARLSDRLAGGSRRLAALVTPAPAMDHPLPSAVDIVRSSLRFVQDSQAANEALLQELLDARIQISGLEQRGAELDRVFFSLRTVEVSFRVETAVLPAEARGVFETLTGGMAKLQLEVEAGFGREFKRLASARQTLGRVAEQLHASLVRQREEGTRRLAGIDAALHRLEEEQAGQQRRLERIAQTTAALDAEAADLVTSIQYQDITRQKMEHIQTALADVSSLADPSCPIALRSAADTCRLEAEQLLGVSRDLEGATAGLRHGSAAILAQLAALETALDGSGGDGDFASALRATTTTLVSAITELRGLTLSANASATEVHGAMKNFAALAEDVAGAAGGLALDIQLIALNSEVQAAQVINGGALEVLAHETCLASEQIGTLSESVRREVVDVNARLRRVSASCARLEDDTRQRCAYLARDGAAAQQNLEAHCAAAIEGVEQLRTDLQALAAEAGTWSAETDAERLPGALDATRDLLLRLAAQCERNQAASERSEASRLSDYTRSYTTREERLIHARVVNGPAGADRQQASPDASAEPAPPADTLVAAAPDRPDAVPSTAGETAPLGDNVELF